MDFTTACILTGLIIGAIGLVWLNVKIKKGNK